ncbi:MAG TPA: preprotein translocase subunit SecG [Chryseosolibacter sp.]
MYTLIIGIIIFFAVLLILVILAQNAKGGGLTSQFGGSSASNIIGVKKTGDLLEKLTWGFMITIMVLSLAMSTNFVMPSGNNVPSNEILERAGEQAPVNVNPNPGINLDTTGGTTAPTDTTK